ncbi:MAG: DUF3108 domain-containing protein [Neomegalonema sp.]|nr:DUF3108 domain-containing protein [Neomegalonema sp.]
MRRKSASIVAVFLILAGMLAGAPARSDEIDLGFPFEVTWTGVPMATGDLYFYQEASDYRIEISGQTIEPFANLVPWSAQIQSSGERVSDTRRPKRYLSDIRSKDLHLRAQIDWTVTGDPIAQVAPKMDPAFLTPVDHDLARQAVDPLSFIAVVYDAIHQSAGTKCDTSTHLWDGERLMKAEVETRGFETLTADRPWSYSGPALTCWVRLQELGGFPKAPPAGYIDEAAMQRVVYLARLNDIWTPVRLEIATPIGRFVGRLKLQ